MTIGISPTVGMATGGANLSERLGRPMAFWPRERDIMSLRWPHRRRHREIDAANPAAGRRSAPARRLRWRRRESLSRFGGCTSSTSG